MSPKVTQVHDLYTIAGAAAVEMSRIIHILSKILHIMRVRRRSHTLITYLLTRSWHHLSVHERQLSTDSTFWSKK